MICPSSFRKNSSDPRRLNKGCKPLLLEICHMRPPSGQDRTYTWYAPDSDDVYATQRPSGENDAPYSLAALRWNGRASCARNWDPSLSTETVQICAPPRPVPMLDS